MTTPRKLTDKEITHLKLNYQYDPKTGYIFGHKGGQITRKNAEGYIYTQYRLDNKRYHISGHRLAYILQTGCQVPDNYILDHIDGIKNNNKWSNFRLATHSENLRNQSVHKNNILGEKGINKRKNGKFQVVITHEKKKIYLGSYATLAEAIAVRKAAEEQYHGDFSFTATQALLTSRKVD